MIRLTLLIALTLPVLNCATMTIHTGTGNLYGREGQKEEGNYFEPATKRDASSQMPACKTEPPVAGNDPHNTAVAPEKTPEKTPEKVSDRSAPGYDDKAKDEEASYFNNQAENPPVVADNSTGEESGTASWYGRDFDGKATASGEPFDSRKLTAAHRTLPLGTVILVKNTENNREALVTVNDRGPFVKGRIVDLSEYGAEMLGYKEKGLTTVSIRVVRRGAMTEKGPGVTSAAFNDADHAQGNGPESVKPQVVTRPKVQAPANIREEKALGKYSVQVGLFSEYDNADKLGKYLTSYNQPVNIFQRGTSYVVKVGEFADKNQAEQLKTRLSSDGYTAFISAP
ncbi:MAG TPA: septal ring lytic transglycosylase RlpA family protein [Leptospiraceae bacterium]|nr:septal ring lytic transglycosylase RlpA family protein [Leptospirales bacterium]HMU83455.1 septal ring lytic transglycosylase RlpA family protein [Leptospiraceae bacterium]HMX57092.1 septal ring lytic transglycosylase RlpA family protein [Leptospiraceae bacterium]HNE22979.1 septal ring lytic transglycosylase RlpA family protein [Leptospiraceae bacterium]HNL02865.1 septal ring lytic transglycosylase RlpA family protein [Leptospiraceae bacterium]